MTGRQHARGALAGAESLLRIHQGRGPDEQAATGEDAGEQVAADPAGLLSAAWSLGWTPMRTPSASPSSRRCRPVLVDPAKLAWAAQLRDTGQIVAKTGIAWTSLYRHLPPRPPDPISAGCTDGAPDRDDDEAVGPPRGGDRP